MMADEEESKYSGVLVVEYTTKHHFDNKKPKGETYHEEDVSFCCAKMKERWNTSDSLAVEFGKSEEGGYFYTQSSKVGVFMVTKDPGWYGDVSYDHWEITCCPFCAGKFELKEVKKVRVDNTCHTRTRTVKEDYCTKEIKTIETLLLKHFHDSPKFKHVKRY